MKTYLTNTSEKKLTTQENKNLDGWAMLGLKSEAHSFPETIVLYKNIRTYGWKSIREFGDYFNVSNVTIFNRINYLEKLGFLKKETKEGKVNIYIYPVPEPQYQDLLPAKKKTIHNDSKINEIADYWNHRFKENRGQPFKFYISDYRRIKYLLDKFKVDELKDLIHHYFRILSDLKQYSPLSIITFHNRIQAIHENYLKHVKMNPYAANDSKVDSDKESRIREIKEKREIEREENIQKVQFENAIKEEQKKLKESKKRKAPVLPSRRGENGD